MSMMNIQFPKRFHGPHFHYVNRVLSSYGATIQYTDLPSILPNSFPMVVDGVKVQVYSKRTLRAVQQGFQ